VGDFASDPDASGQSLVAALSICSENSVIAGGCDKMQSAIEQRMERARNGDQTVPETLAKPGGGLAGATVLGKDMNFDELEKMLGKYMAKKVRKSWPEKERGPGMNMKGEMVVNGLQLGNIWSKSPHQTSFCRQSIVHFSNTSSPLTLDVYSNRAAIARCRR
jgi:magnesium chelatase subunit H